MESLVETLKYIEEDSVIAYTILTYGFNPLQVVEYCKTKEDTKPMIAKILRGSMQNNVNNAPVVHVNTQPVKLSQLTSLKNNSEEAKKDYWNMTYSFELFYKELMVNGRTFTSLNDADEFFIPRLCAFVRKIIDGNQVLVVIKNSTDGVVSIRKYSEFMSDFSIVKNWSYSVTVDKQVKVVGHKGMQNMKVNEVHSIFGYLDSSEYLVHFGHDWIPYSPWEKDPTTGTKFNLFTEFQAKAIPKERIERSKFEIPLQHIWIVLAMNDNDILNWILSWLHYMIKYPRRDLPALGWIGKQGCGKTSFVTNFLFKLVLGEKYTFECNSIDDIVRQFNDHLDQKICINIAELKACGNSDTSIYNKLNTLKSKITDANVAVEGKGLKVVKRTNYMKFIFQSNDINSLRFDEDNRRYQVLGCSDVYKGNKEYFNKLHESFTQEAADHFYSWLYYLDEIEPTRIVKNLDKFIMTQQMKDIIKLSFSDTKFFCMEMMNEDSSIVLKYNSQCVDDKDVVFIDNEKLVKVSKSFLFEKFNEWQKLQKSFKVVAGRWFYPEVDSLLTVVPRDEKNTKEYYVILKTSLKIGSSTVLGF